MPESNDQLQGESEAAYAAYLTFRDQGRGRTISKAWRTWCAQQKLESAGKSPTRWYTWRDQHQWLARVRDWENWQLREEAALVREQVMAHHQQSLKVINSLLGLSIETIAAVQKAKERRPRELWELSRAVDQILERRDILMDRVRIEAERGDPTTLDVVYHVIDAESGQAAVDELTSALDQLPPPD